MNSQEIESLIRKYELGETSLQEEQKLKAYFAQDDIPVEFRVYKDLFGFFDVAVKEEYPDPDFDNRFFDNLGVSTGNKQRQLIPFNRRMIWSIAASIILLFGLFFILNNNQQPVNTFDDPELAYAETKKALMLISGNLNEGMNELSNIKTFDQGVDELKNIKSFNEGLKTMEKLSAFERSTNYIKQ